MFLNALRTSNKAAGVRKVWLVSEDNDESYLPEYWMKEGAEGVSSYVVIARGEDIERPQAALDVRTVVSGLFPEGARPLVDKYVLGDGVMAGIDVLERRVREIKLRKVASVVNGGVEEWVEADFVTL